MAVLRNIVMIAVITSLAIALTACDRDITTVVTEQEASSCVACHVDDNLITGKQTQWDESGHGTGTSYVRGSSSSCVGCHSGNGFQTMIAAGLNPGEMESGDPDPTRQDCRACHRVHVTYTGDDFALRTTAPVTLYAMDGVTYNGGSGNLCVNCHQPRRVLPEPVDGMITGINSHWGPHHGPQSAMLMGVAGGGVDDMPGGHYGAPQNTCVTCHMGENADHHFEVDLDNCLACHPDAESFNIGNVQVDTEALIFELGELLVAANLIDENTEDGHPIVSEAPEAQATALWNWLYVAHEDKSLGVHNPAYAKALLEAGIALMTP